MADIVERLLAFYPPYGWPEERSTIVEPPLNKVAADTIEALRAENARLLKKNAVLEEAWRNSRHERSKQFPLVGSAAMGESDE